MPDLPDRFKYEKELAAALLLAWEDARLDVLAGTEPDWDALALEIERQAEQSLAAVAIAAALLMMIDLSGTQRLPLGFGEDTGQARALADGLVKTRREAWAEGIDPEAYNDRWFSEYAAESIGITETTGAISLGEALLQAELLANGVEVVAVWRIDPRSNVCPVCLKLNGKSEKFWEDEFPNGPPAHPNCILGETTVRAASVVSVFRAKYDGPIIRIECADGSSFGVTPNHMLLTTQGFIQAVSLHEGDDILRCLPVEVPLAGPNDNDKPPTIEEVFSSLSVSSGVTSSSVPASAEYLHGDAVRCHGEIDIVRPDSKLWGGVDPKFLEPPLHGDLKLASMRKRLLSSSSDLRSVLNALLLATDGGVSSIRERRAILLGHLREPNIVGLGSCPDRQAHFDELFADWSAGYTERLGHTKDAFPGVVSTEKIVSIKIEHVSTYVYDMETEESMYTVGAHFVSSNCRCYKTYHPI